MGKRKDKPDRKGAKGHAEPAAAEEDYSATLHALQIELVKLQKHVIAKGKKLLVLLEGRDAGGKDGAIKRITEHMSPRDTRVVALGKPSDRDLHAWYFQRYVAHLPIDGEIVLFNRSWYNRAGVETVMGFCNDDELENFFVMVNPFEHLLRESGILLSKYYLDISKAEQKERLEDRRQDPLKQWKLSPIDAVAHDNWRAYSKARNQMFARTHTPFAPWTIVAADDKKAARLQLIRDILAKCDYKGKDEELTTVDPNVVFSYAETALKQGLIAP